MKKFTEYLKKYFDKKEITLGLLIFAMVFVILGSTFAYWRWNSTIEQRTNITFTANPAFTCSVNGGGDITSSDIQLQPTTCTDSEHIIKRKIKYSRDITQRDLNVSYILNLKVSEIGEGLANSDNFRYALTSSESSCDTDVISSGKVQDDALLIKTSYSSSGYEEAYLWIWLDAEEEDPSTMNQEFKATLGGTCEIKPEGPMLVDGKTFNNLVFTELGNVYSEKTGMDTFYPNIVTVYSNGNLPYGISKETLETYANIDISSKKMVQ